MRKINKNNKNKNNKNTQNGNYALTRLGAYTGRDKPSITFLDPHRYVTLRYYDNFNVSLATITGTNQKFNLNSIYDPDRTGTGHQPYGYDQLSAIYNRYRVLKTKWKCTFSPSSGSYELVVLPLNGDLNTAITNNTTFVSAAENPRAFNWIQGASGQSFSTSRMISLNDLNGCTLIEYLADDRFEAQIGANPTELMTLNIGLYNPNAGTIIINFVVELYFEVDLHDIISLPGS